MHHSYSSSLSPFQAKTGMPIAAIARRRLGRGSRRCLHELQRTLAPSCLKVSISTPVRTLMWRHPMTDDPARRGSGEKKP